jgi:hypothetical protein
VNSPGDQPKANFWLCCPRQLQYLPETACHLGKISAETRREECAWYVNSEQDHYCFWRWIRRVSDKDGFMEPLLQSEISALLGLSNSKINQHFNEALEKIKDLPEFEDLQELF